MSKALPKTQPGALRLEATQSGPGSKQMGFSWEANQRVIAAQDFLTDLFRSALKAAGTTEWLTKALNRAPSYETKINDAIAGRDERSVQLPWLAPLLDDANAAYALIAGLCERCGYLPPERKKEVKPEALGVAALEVLGDLDEEMREVMKKRVAKKLGVRVEDVKL